jgi:hypothetical protein
MFKSICLEDPKRNGRMIAYFVACQKVEHMIYVRIHGNGLENSLFDLFIKRTIFPKKLHRLRIAYNSKDSVALVIYEVNYA